MCTPASCGGLLFQRWEENKIIDESLVGGAQHDQLYVVYNGIFPVPVRNPHPVPAGNALPGID